MKCVRVYTNYVTPRVVCSAEGNRISEGSMGNATVSRSPENLSRTLFFGDDLCGICVVKRSHAGSVLYIITCCCGSKTYDAFTTMAECVGRSNESVLSELQ